MVISNESKLFGYVLGEILASMSSLDQVSIGFEIKSKRNAYSYIVFKNGTKICSFAIYLKTSSKRLAPWRFTFLKEHQEYIDELYDTHDDVFLALINGNDGVACFNYETLKILLDDHFDESEWVSVRRKSGEQYTVAGKDGKLTGKLPLSEFPSVIVNFISKKMNPDEVSQTGRSHEDSTARRKLFGFL